MIVDGVAFQLSFGKKRLNDCRDNPQYQVVAYAAKYELAYYSEVYPCDAPNLSNPETFVEDLTALLPSAKLEFKGVKLNKLLLSIPHRVSENTYTYKFELLCIGVDVKFIRQLHEDNTNLFKCMIQKEEQFKSMKQDSKLQEKYNIVVESLTHSDAQINKLRDELETIKKYNDFLTNDNERACKEIVELQQKLKEVSLKKEADLVADNSGIEVSYACSSGSGSSNDKEIEISGSLMEARSKSYNETTALVHSWYNKNLLYGKSPVPRTIDGYPIDVDYLAKFNSKTDAPANGKASNLVDQTDKSKIYELNEVIRTIKEDMFDLKKENTKLKDLVKTLSDSDNSTRELMTANAKNADLITQLHELHAQQLQLKQDCIRAAEAADSITNLNTKYETRIAFMSDQITSLDDTLARLTQSNDTIAIEMSELREENERLSSVIKELSDTNESTAKIITLKKKITDLKEQLVSLETHNVRLESTNEQLTKQIDEYLVTLDIQKKLLLDKEKELKTGTSKLAGLVDPTVVTTIRKLESDIVQLKKHNEFLYNENDALTLRLRAAHREGKL
jgi:hypothetical protein